MEDKGVKIRQTARENHEKVLEALGLTLTDTLDSAGLWVVQVGGTWMPGGKQNMMEKTGSRESSWEAITIFQEMGEGSLV